MLRSKVEYERFAEIVDELQLKDPHDREGAYLAEQGHVVLWKPTSMVVARHLAESVFDRVDGSDRWAPWWLRDGAAELFVSLALEQLSQGKDLEYYVDRYATAKRHIDAEGPDLSIFSVLETLDYKEREQRNRALAMTLVDYLQSKKRRGFRSFVAKVRSPDAPAPPTTDSEADFKSFHRKYIVFQEKALESFAGKLSSLEDAWKAHVLKTAARLEARDPSRRDAG
ncbi:MAG: hypothetical protein O7J95_06380 [Planctomycetota bacterium]|nr:hypothetical protein [Planctomycetota bacterium]